ncbi:MAG: hypothetical protein JWN14_2105 [Chthonomonadales bacterium]|nr:hypothetical protein [Chthonomonadales bacterium]
MRTIIHKLLMRACACLFFACLYSWTADSVSAQRNPVYMSIEAHVAQAEDVYVGTISQVGLFEHDKKGDYGATITVDATETLKGSHRKRFQVFAYGDKTREPFQAWSLKRTPLLWFIRPKSADDSSDSPSKGWSFFPVDPADSMTPLPMVGYFSLDFRLIRSPRQILAIARRYAKTSSHSQTATIHSLCYMQDLVCKLFPYTTGGELLVPVGPELERAARRMILSPGSFLPSEREIKGIGHDDYLAVKASDEGSVRRMGVEALAHFKSGANIDLLKRQLDDTFLESNWDNDHDVYAIRKVAFKALQKWNVKVAEPPLHPSPDVSGQAKQANKR